MSEEYDDLWRRPEPPAARETLTARRLRHLEAQADLTPAEQDERNLLREIARNRPQEKP